MTTSRHSNQLGVTSIQSELMHGTAHIRNSAEHSHRWSYVVLKKSNMSLHAQSFSVGVSVGVCSGVSASARAAVSVGASAKNVIYQ